MCGDLQEKNALYAKPSLVLLEVGYSRPFNDVGYIIKQGIHVDNMYWRGVVDIWCGTKATKLFHKIR